MSAGMGIDVRIPIGAMFTLIGAIITIFGLVSDKEIYEQHSLGINVNFWWGLVMFAFGAFMLLMAWRAAKKEHKSKSNL